TGEICLDILKDAWTPIWTLESACRAIIALLSHPAADSPLNCDAGTNTKTPPPPKDTLLLFLTNRLPHLRQSDPLRRHARILLAGQDVHHRVCRADTAQG